MNESDLTELGTFFTLDGKDRWRLEYYCPTPTCGLRNVETGQIERFGMGGLTAQRFMRTLAWTEADETQARIENTMVAVQKQLQQEWDDTHPIIKVFRMPYDLFFALMRRVQN